MTTGGMPLTCFLLTLGVLVGELPAAAQPVVVGSLTEVRFVDYPGAVETYANEVNANGDVVGDFYLPDESYFSGYVLLKGVFTRIQFPGAIETFALGINSLGQVVGLYRMENPGPYRGYLWQDGVFSEVAIPGATSLSMIAINDSGTIVGGFSDEASVAHGFVWRAGVLTQIDVSGAQDQTAAHGINARGAIVGSYVDQQSMWRGFVLDKSVLTPVDVPDALYTLAWGIGASGTVVGECLLCTETSLGAGFILDGAGFFLASVDGAETTRFFKINQSGWIAGAATYPEGEVLVRGILARR